VVFIDGVKNPKEEFSGCDDLVGWNCFEIFSVFLLIENWQEKSAQQSQCSAVFIVECL
jgi:hypothetical protein